MTGQALTWAPTVYPPAAAQKIFGWRRRISLRSGAHEPYLVTYQAVAWWWPGPDDRGPVAPGRPHLPPSNLEVRAWR